MTASVDWSLVGTAAALCSVCMLAGWVWQWRGGKIAIVDVIWAWLTGIVGVWWALGNHAPEALRAGLLAAMIGIWAGRLGVHLARRVAAEDEDGRYRAMRDALGTKAQPVFFVFFQVQALWALLFAAPVLAAAGAARPALDWLDYLGLAVFAVAWAGENLADRQLDAFRRNSANKGQVCKVGLWRYSRHPNYFFEWLHWFAYPLIGWGAPLWWLTAAGPVVMLVFLYRLTGIPYTEQQALRSRGDAYREYQRTTSAFIPLPPRTAEDA